MKRIIPVLIVGILVLSGLGAGALLETDLGSFSPTNYTDEYDMVIIAPEKFSTGIQPLIEHKNSHDVETFLKTTENIYSEYSGRDDAEKIKYFIKDAIEQNHITYVLLMGGKKWQLNSWHVPVRYSNLDDNDRYTFFISDLYYADIYKNGTTDFEDWDSDGDGIFAEWGQDELDLLPDVHVGRLPCRNRLEVRTIVQKIIQYETTTYGQQWFNTIVAVGGDQFPAFPGLEGEETCEEALSHMPGFTPIRLYISTGNLTSSDDVIDAINQGCGFVFTRGKGGTDRVRITQLDGTELIALHNQFLYKLKNKDKYPVVFLAECFHGKIDVSLLNIPKFLRNESNILKQDCVPWTITWWLVRKNNGGAIAVITNSNTCYATTGDSNQNGIPDDAEIYGGGLAVESLRLYGEEGRVTLGELYTHSLKSYILTYPVYSNLFHSKSVQEYILIGDPSLQIGGYE